MFLFFSLNWCHSTMHSSSLRIIAEERRVECNAVRVFHAIPGIHDVTHSNEHCGVAPNLPNDQNQNFPIFAMANFPSSYFFFFFVFSNEKYENILIAIVFGDFNVLPDWWTSGTSSCHFQFVVASNHVPKLAALHGFASHAKDPTSQTVIND